MRWTSRALRILPAVALVLTVAAPGSGERSDEPAVDALDDLAYLGAFRTARDEAGVLVHDRERVRPGALLVVSGHRPGASLVDTGGRLLHEWSVSFGRAFDRDREPAPGSPSAWWRRARLLPDGSILAIFEGRGLVKLDRDSEVVWARPGGYHHDLELTPDGSLLVLDRVRAPRRSRSGVAGTRAHDRVVRLSAAGEPLKEISLERALLRSPWAELIADRDRRRDPLHTNTLTRLDGRYAAVDPAFEEGNLLLSFRTIDAVAVLDPERREIVWLRRGPWRAQHEPILLPGGRLLLFDNRGLEGRSRVLETDLASGEITWSWSGGDLETFRSKQLGSVQALAGGDVLVTDSMDGRAFQVTRAGEVVWRYDNPHRVGEGRRLVGALAEVVRVPESKLAWLRRGRVR